MTGYEISVDKGVEMSLMSSVAKVTHGADDKRLHFARNWSTRDLQLAYYEKCEYNDRTIRICTDKKEAYKLYNEVCNECESGYFWTCGNCYLKFDVARMDMVEVEYDDGELEIVDFYDTLEEYIAPIEIEEEEQK